MNDIIVRPIELPRDAGRFVHAWWPISSGDPHWVPPLRSERESFLDPGQNPYFRVAKIRGFMAYRGARALGTIAATIDDAQQLREPGVGLFGFFEFVDDVEVARALLDAACAWLREQGMTVARGPFNFNQNHDFGLLVDGFDVDPAVANTHNAAYYSGIYEQIGLRPIRDWYAYWLDAGPIPPAIERLARRVEERHPELRIETLDANDYERGVLLFREIFNDAWDNNWGHIPMAEDEFVYLGRRLKPLLDPGLCFFAFVGDECVAGSIALPDSNPVLKKMNGSIFPFGWWHAWRGAKHINAMRVLVLGVKHRYQKFGFGAPIYQRTWAEALRRGYRGCDASLVLDNNRRMRSALEKLGGRIYMTYRAYERRLDG
jgi:GNAT superfamily N-acetyltransferase